MNSAQSTAQSTAPKRLSLFGSTGSIGVSSLDVVRHQPGQFEVYALTAGRNWQRLAEQVNEFNPTIAVLADEQYANELEAALSSHPCELRFGSNAVAELGSAPEVDVVISAIVGAAGLQPTLNALHAGKVVGIANKEPLVMAGDMMIAAAKASGATILPIDSEHSAVFQCLQGNRTCDVAKIVLTASGGPFRQASASDLAEVTREDALKHPTWDMGAKITIDSATLMNKTLEIVEAKWLFDTDADHIEVMIHPQSIIHSMVYYVDGSVMAQMGLPDMRVPIQYAMSYPNRWQGPVGVPDFVTLGQLDFEAPRRDVFPSLDMGYHVCRAGGYSGAVLNAANEVAVERFLKEEINFTDIFRLLDKALAHCPAGPASDIAALVAADQDTRERVKSW